MSKTYAAGIIAILAIILPAAGVDVVNQELLGVQVENFVAFLANVFIVADRLSKKDISWLGLRK